MLSAIPTSTSTEYKVVNEQLQILGYLTLDSGKVSFIPESVFHSSYSIKDLASIVKLALDIESKYAKPIK